MAYTKNTYILPFDKKHFVDAVSIPTAHPYPIQHAIDFGLPEGTIIKAPRAGTVVAVKDDSKEGGTARKYRDNYKYGNQVVLLHRYNEASLYVHIKHNGALVRAGDKVKQGQPIALSGNTGYSTEPHLHFMVCKSARNYMGIQSLKIRFKQKVKVTQPKRSKKEVAKEVKRLEQQVRRSKKQLEKIKQQVIDEYLQNTREK